MKAHLTSYLEKLAHGERIPREAFLALLADPTGREELARLHHIRSLLTPFSPDVDAATLPPSDVTVEELALYFEGRLLEDHRRRQVEHFLEQADASHIDSRYHHMDVTPERPRRTRRTELIIAMMMAGVVAVIQWVVPALMTSSVLAYLDYWRLVQHWLIWSGIGLSLSIPLLGLLFRRIGWIRRRRVFLPLALLTFLCVLAVSLGLVEFKKVQIRSHLDAMFLRHRWIAYDSPNFDPYKPSWPTEDQIESELKRLNDQGGFDGLITFGADGTFPQVPRIAKERAGFKAIIMGVYLDPLNREKWEEQFRGAIAAKEYVDGYCVGHNAPSNIPLSDLAARMADLRSETGKPVTTTFPLNHYVGDRGQPVREIGDWYFPDVRGAWSLGTTPGMASEEFRQILGQTVALPRNKPVLLKMVGYPSAGADGLTEEAQRQFYMAIARDLPLPPGVYVSFFAGYDVPFKTRHPEHWTRPEGHIGLFTEDGRPKPAVDIVRTKFPIQSRP
jgi:hypothetical protein